MHWHGTLHNESKSFVFENDTLFNEDKTIIIIYIGRSKTYNIPKSVKSIGKYAFLNCHSLTSINIPDSVTSIGNNTFNGCDSLTCVNISDSVKSIGESAFYRCKNLNQQIKNDIIKRFGTIVF